MSSTGQAPKTGFRMMLARPAGDRPPYAYRGTFDNGNGDVPIKAEVDATGRITTSAEGPEREAIAERVRLFVRAALQNARRESGDEKAPPPRKIARWRGEK